MSGCESDSEIVMTGFVLRIAVDVTLVSFGGGKDISAMVQFVALLEIAVYGLVSGHGIS